MTDQAGREFASRARKRLRRESNEDFLADLPVECARVDRSDQQHAGAILRRGWTEWALNRENLVQKALEILDMVARGGEICEGTEYNDEKAYDMLMRWGHADSEHFLVVEEPMDDTCPRGLDENGWNMQILFAATELSFAGALKLVDEIVLRIARIERDQEQFSAFYDSDDDDNNNVGPRDELALAIAALPLDCAKLRQRVRSLLSKRAQRSSIRYARYTYEYRRTDSLGGGVVEDSLLFLTSDNRQVELAGRYDWHK